MIAWVRLAPDFPVLTERLALRPLTLADTDALHAYRSLPEVCRYVPFMPMTPEAISERILGRWSGTTIEAEGDGLLLGVELTESGTVIGDVMLVFKSAEHRGGEVGWVFNPAYGGRGYATEAAHALLHLAFDGLGLHRVTAMVDGRNDASLRLCARLGMRREAVLLSNEWFKGEWTDEIDFALLESEWVAQHPGGVSSCGLGPRAAGAFFTRLSPHMDNGGVEKGSASPRGG
jgi:RimJ/RimL family protein N-acetyltransferase